jgi:CBS domain-containing protein
LLCARSFLFPAASLACILIGVCGGIMGAAFNASHAMLSRRRLVWVRRPLPKVLEVLCVSLLTSLAVFGLSLYGECQPVNELPPGGGGGGDSGGALVPVLCNTSDEPWRLQWATAEGRAACGAQEYNDMATALLVGQRRVIVSMMEEPERYSVTTLLAVGVTSFCLMTVTYGAAIPAGVFVPTILAGGCFGALAGIGLTTFFEGFVDCPVDSWCHELAVRPAPYALQGAVALLGGVQRSSLALVVIILEGTGAVQQLLPIILTTVVAKWTGDLLHTGGLYTVALQLKQIPFLGDGQTRANRGKVAADVMTEAGRRGDGVVCFQQVEPSVRDVLAKLSSCTHNGFPVVGEERTGRRGFRGLVLRNQLYTLIAQEAFGGRSTKPTPTNGADVDPDPDADRDGGGDSTDQEWYSDDDDDDDDDNDDGHADGASELDGTVEVSGSPDSPPGQSSGPGPHRARRRHGSSRRRQRKSGGAKDGGNGVGGGDDNDDDDDTMLLRTSTSCDDQLTREFLEEFVRKSGGGGGGVGGFDIAAARPHRSSVPRIIEAIESESSSVRGGRSTGSGSGGSAQEHRENSTLGGSGGGRFAQASLDLRRIMHRTPFTVDALTPLQRVWRLFRAMGLRHLVVLDGNHCVCGMITRADLLQSTSAAGGGGGSAGSSK